MRCFICHRKLSDPDSIQRGTGPECAGTLAALAGSGLSTPQIGQVVGLLQWASESDSDVSLAEIGAMALSGNATVVRQINLANQAIRRGHHENARFFLRFGREEFEKADYSLEALAEAAA